ncbi:MAG TPA: alpha/beta hydrolase [Actinocrinis sp.]|uniref:alpha/beta fold hydrolase n=1 Tax=Actinocrinis sp. TaxID=1920516 RepID=UPI002DDCBFD8|nr:alpha/beta hydrolase [Actinocrinis sp.]HEV3169890.1 alpha/beta hydrolase [Actinocrinis sp.]
MNPEMAEDQASDASVETAPSRWRPRLKRWGRRIAIGCAALLVLTTAASFVFNAFTAERALPPPGLTYVEADGIRTRYQEWGSTGTPIVLVHGAFESVDTWSRLAPLLARGHRVYAFDLTGYGYTQRKGPYTVDHQTDQLLGFLDAMHLGGTGDRPVLVGHSSGAAVVSEAALRSPGRIAGLMLLDGDALNTGAGPPTAFRYILINPFKTSILRIGLSSDALIRSFYNSQCGPGCPTLDHAGVDVWRRPFQVSGAEDALWSMLDAGVPGLPASQLTDLHSVNLPKSVVFGGKDDVFSPQTPTQTAERIGAPPPTIIPNAKHLTMISNPDEVAAAIRALTARAPA